VRPTLFENHFGFAFVTVPGRIFHVEYKTSLDEPLWHPWQIIQGDGQEHFVFEGPIDQPRRFYRFRVE